MAFLRDWRLLFYICGAAFLISCEYSITRPASNSLLITLFSSAVLPWVWLATVPLNLAVVWLYNRYLSRVGPLAMLGSIALLTIAINAITALVIPIFPAWIFLQFAWKDIYVLLMFKQLWSLIHSTSLASRAKHLYGLIYGMGTVGAVLGGLVPGFLAVEFGSECLFFFTLPAYLAFFLCYRKALQWSSLSPAETVQPAGGFATIWRSPFLCSLLLLVLFMQVAVGLMEFQFNAHLELNILDKDLRTQYTGWMISLMNLLSGGLQLIGSFIIVHFFGLRHSHLAIPLLLLVNVAGCMVFPSFGLISFAFVFTKAIDFSLFGVAREMLYIPLKPEEKFQAKAVIDVFVHRSAKALVSLCILAVQLSLGTQSISWIGPAAAIVLVLWVALVWIMFRRQSAYA